MKFYTAIFKTEVFKTDSGNDFLNPVFVGAGTVFKIESVGGFGVQMKTICGKYAINGAISPELLKLAFKESDFIQQ